MLIVVVRLGKRIDPANLQENGISLLLANVRSFIPIVGMVDLEKYVELEVTHDSFGLDRNVEHVKITVYIEETDKACRRAVLWRDLFIKLVDECMDAAEVPHDLVGDFQVNLVIGGHRAGAVFDRIWDKQSPGWVDEHLVLAAQKPTT